MKVHGLLSSDLIVILPILRGAGEGQASGWVKVGYIMGWNITVVFRYMLVLENMGRSGEARSGRVSSLVLELIF